MSKVDLDLDAKINNLELEWRLAYEASIAARADYQALAALRSTGASILDASRERLERAESKKDRIMARIEHLGDALLRERQG